MELGGGEVVVDAEVALFSLYRDLEVVPIRCGGVEDIFTSN